MEIVPGVSEELMLAATASGPKCKDQPYIRAPFPAVALPRVLRKFCMAAAEAMGVPLECLATPALATCAAAIGNTCRVRLSGTWSEPAVIWAVTLMALRGLARAGWGECYVEEAGPKGGRPSFKFKLFTRPVADHSDAIPANPEVVPDGAENPPA
jgi:hypothetical protein